MNPFAQCPVCRAGVFFFQAANGGRVFFDDLGPPWPKHPCTDREGQAWRVAVDRTLERVAGSPRPNWERDGWSPFVLKEVRPASGERCYLVSGFQINESCHIYRYLTIRGEFFTKFSDWTARWRAADPTFLRQLGPDYELCGITMLRDQVVEHSVKGRDRLA